MSRLKSYLVFIILICTLTGCMNALTYYALIDHINTIPVINTHEHQQFPAQREKDQDFNFYHILKPAYVNSDIISAQTGTKNRMQQKMRSSTRWPGIFAAVPGIKR